MAEERDTGLSPDDIAALAEVFNTIMQTVTGQDGGRSEQPAQQSTGEQPALPLPPPPPAPGTGAEAQFFPDIPDAGTGVVIDTQAAGVQQWLARIAGFLVAQPAVWRALASLVSLRGGRGTLSPACARLMLDELPEQKRRAVDQFLCGVEFPIGLNSDGESTFAAIRIAASGITAPSLGGCGCGGCGV